MKKNDFEKLLEIQNALATDLAAAGQEKIDADDYIGAIADLSEAVSLNPGSCCAFLSLGIAFAALDKHEEAVENFEKVLEINPNCGCVRYPLGLSYLQTWNIEEAHETFEEFLKQEIPDDAEEHYLRGRACFELGRYTEAIKHYTGALDFDKDQAEIYYQRCLAYVQLGNMEAAKQDFKLAIDLDPNWFLGKDILV